MWSMKLDPLVLTDIFELINELKNKSYEGNSPELILSIMPTRLKNSSSSKKVKVDKKLLSSKKTCALFVGHRNMIVCDIDGSIIKVESLQPYRDYPYLGKSHNLYLAPYEYQPLFNFSKKKRSLIFILNRHREIMVLINGELFILNNENKWKLFSGEKFANSIKNAFDDLSDDIKEEDYYNKIKSYILAIITMTMRHRRKGGLLVVCNIAKVDKIVNKKDINDNDVEILYQSLFSLENIARVPISMMCNILSIDGATIITPELMLVRYGHIINTKNYKRNKSEGARTRAAEYCSNYGYVIKISEDGPINIFRSGKMILNII